MAMSARSLSGLLDEALSRGQESHYPANVISMESAFGFRGKLAGSISGGGSDSLATTVEEALVLEGGGSTPNDVRHFPPSLPTTTATMTGGMSLPVSQLDRSPHKLGHDEEQALAEYRESLMYQRMVGFQQQREQESRRRHSIAATTTADTKKQEPTLLLRPRRQDQQELSLVEMLSPSERRIVLPTAGGSWTFLAPAASSAAPAFPARYDSDNNNPHSGDFDVDDDDNNDDEDHHDGVFELDL